MLSRKRSLKSRRDSGDLSLRIDRDENQNSISPTPTSPIAETQSPLTNSLKCSDSFGSFSQITSASTHSTKTCTVDTHMLNDQNYLNTTSNQAKENKARKLTPILKPLDLQQQNLRQIVTPSSAHPLSAGSVDTGTQAAFSSIPYKYEPSEIIPFLYLGSEKNASSKAVLVRKNIQYIVNVGKECKNHFETAPEDLWVRYASDKSGKSSSTVNTFDMESQQPTAQSSTSSSTLNTDYSYNEGSFPLSPVYNHLNLISAHTSSRPRSAPIENFSTSPPTSKLAEKLSRNTRFDHCLNNGTLYSPSFTTTSSTTSLLLHSYSPLDTSSDTQPEVDTSQFVPPSYLKLPWSHSEDHLLQYFKNAFEFIDEARRNGKAVLVHCKQGVSRSATLVIAYVMREMNISMNEAYAIVKEKSPCVSPNLGLIYQLLEYEKQLDLNGNGSNGDRDAGTSSLLLDTVPE